jgi:hypothetical protein
MTGCMGLGAKACSVFCQHLGGTVSFLEALSKDRRVILQPCMSCLSGCEPKLQLDGSGNGGVLAVVTSLKVLHLGLLTVVHLCCL